MNYLPNTSQFQNNYVSIVKNSRERYVLSDVSNLINGTNLPSNIMVDSKENPQNALSNHTKQSDETIDYKSTTDTGKNTPDNKPSCSSVMTDSVEENESSRSRRKPRTVFSRSQLNKMKEAFNCKPYLTTDERKMLAAELSVTPEQVKVWFQNHRSKLKRQGRLITTTTTCLNNNKPQNETLQYAVNPFPNNMGFTPMAYNFNNQSSSYMKPVYNYNQGLSTNDYYQSTQYQPTEGVYSLPVYQQLANPQAYIDPNTSYLYQNGSHSSYVKPFVLPYASPKLNEYNNVDPSIYTTNNSNINGNNQKTFKDPK